jgi:Family of unknown function (DUF6338)
MSWAQSEIVQLLTFLAPGLVSLVVFYGLTSLPKPSEFERVVQALIFTLVAQSIVAGLQSSLLWLGPAEPWSPRSELIISVTIGFVLGLLAAIVTNTDIIHRPLRRIGITQETSFPSVWYSTFQREKLSYVVLHLSGERRLYGWPEEWPNSPNEGHFRISQPEWLVDSERIVLQGVVVILIPSSAVEMVEFLPHI